MKTINIENRKMFLNYVESTMLDFQQTLKSNLAPSNQIKGVKELVEQLLDIVNTKLLTVKNVSKLISYLEKNKIDFCSDYEKNFDQISREHIYMYGFLSIYFDWKKVNSNYKIIQKNLNKQKLSKKRHHALKTENKNKLVKKLLKGFSSNEKSLLSNICFNIISKNDFISDINYIDFVFHELLENLETRIISNNEIRLNYLWIFTLALFLKYIHLVEEEREILIEYIMNFGIDMEIRK